MERIAADELARQAGGALAAGDPATLVGPDVVSDSRGITPGCLFVAIRGERVDGHDFVADALGAGAAAALVQGPVGPTPDGALIRVGDTLAGLAGLARHVVTSAAASGLVVVGITGSSGKTSTKDLLAQVLETAGPTVAPVGSFNNEIGVPLTACRVDAGTRHLVVEMGARGIGHVAWLCGVTPPAVGAVLNVGHAHLGEFGSVEGIARAKGELVEALGPDGWAVLNADDPRVLAMASRTSARLATFSVRGEPDSGDLRVWASDAVADDLQRFTFTLHASGHAAGHGAVALRVMGEHQVANAAAAAAVALASGLELGTIAAALSEATPRSPWRMQLDERADGLALLNDSYNANPDSMDAALVALSRLRRPGGRLVAALGDMLELGADADVSHRAVGARARQLGIDELVAVGSFCEPLVDGFGGADDRGRAFASKDLAGEYLTTVLHPRDVLLVKASRGLAFDTLADHILEHGEGGPR